MKGRGQATGCGQCFMSPSELQHCWLGDRKGIRRLRQKNSLPLIPKCCLPEQQLLLQHLFNGLFSRTTWVSRHPKGKILDFIGARDDGVAVASAGPYANHLLLAPDR